MSSNGTTSTIVLVTGANQGIGFEISKKLATEQQGYHVIMAGRRKDAVEEAVSTLKKQGLSVEGLIMDVTSDEAIAAAVAEIETKHGHLDVLINNAAISGYGEGGKGGEGREAWAAVFDANVAGVAAVTDAFLPLLKKSKTTKRIVFVSSTLGSFATKMQPGSSTHRMTAARIYSCSKAALNMLACHYITQYEDDPTWKINLCCPGYCATNLNNYAGLESPATGAINVCRLATLGPDGETGTYSSKNGPIPW